MAVACTEIAHIDGPGFSVHLRAIAGDGAARGRPRWRTRRHILSCDMLRGEPVAIRHTDTDRGFAKTGPVLFFPHATAWEADRYVPLRRCVSLYLDPGSIDLGARDRAVPCSFDDATTVQMMRALHAELVSPRKDSAAIVAGIAGLLQSRLRLLLDEEAEGDAAPDVLGAIDAALEQRGFAASADELAQALRMSRRHLLRKIRAASGLSTRAFIERRRVERARRLLVSSAWCLKRIAFEAGYSSPSEFSTRFRATTGLTPTAFRLAGRA